MIRINRWWLEKLKFNYEYYDLVLPVNYKLKSYDMFFQTEYHIVSIINTDLDRTKKIAEFIKTNLNFDYVIE